MSAGVISALNYMAPPMVKAGNFMSAYGLRLACRVAAMVLTCGSSAYLFEISKDRATGVVIQGSISLFFTLGVDSLALPWIKRHSVGVIALSSEAIVMSSWLLRIGQFLTPIVLTRAFLRAQLGEEIPQLGVEEWPEPPILSVIQFLFLSVDHQVKNFI